MCSCVRLSACLSVRFYASVSVCMQKIDEREKRRKKGTFTKLILTLLVLLFISFPCTVSAVFVCMCSFLCHILRAFPF